MGKPSPPEANHAESLHTQHLSDRFLDEDALDLQVDDLLPLYDDGNSRTPLLPNTPSSVPFEDLIRPFKTDVKTGNVFYLDRRLDEDPQLLEKYMLWWAQMPPRVFVQIQGSHTEWKDRNGDSAKDTTETIIDFDVSVELTPYHSDSVNRVSRVTIRTVENSEKARRGTRLRRRAHGANETLQSIEEAWLANKPTLAEWCHRYCASHAGLKCMTLQRRIIGLDENYVQQKLKAMLHATRYCGEVTVSFPVMKERVDVYNDCKTNMWRLNGWIAFLCFITLMFPFCWLYLFFRTKRFEVVFADWPFSFQQQDGSRRYVGISEDQWCNIWGPSICRAALERRKQVTLDQRDIILASQMPDPVYGNNNGCIIL
ncbi:hypothetical protein B0H66DRAFT_569657 [Apodospora peruviana]|uniref:Uncharacterized protein n=1 Tax=Apodospora peruviana TaxID=516989 RepID=A0AAE0LZ03_9PEZI|nr:hypothetical protein B0H66DRAFT_569657 [Apodospora peruviana]